MTNETKKKVVEAVHIPHDGGVWMEVVEPAKVVQFQADAAALIDAFLERTGHTCKASRRDAIRGLIGGAILSARAVGMTWEEIEPAIRDGVRVGREAVPLGTIPGDSGPAS